MKQIPKLNKLRLKRKLNINPLKWIFKEYNKKYD